MLRALRPALLSVVLAAPLAGCGSPAAPVALDDGGTGPDAAIGERDAAVLPDAWDECTPVALSPTEVDRLILVDTTASWSRRADRFAGARDAVVASAAGSGHTHALATFPAIVGDATSCEASDHDTLAVGWGTGTSIGGPLASPTFAGESALGPALEGAIELARARARAMPDRLTSIVLVTDATPGDDEACGTWDEAAAIAGEGLAAGGAESVQTHVISVMGTAVADEHFGRIDAIATAGGGSASFVNGSEADVEAATLDALATIDTRAATCSMRLPGGGFLPARLIYAWDDGTEVALDRVPDAEHCALGAFYVDDETSPRVATVCSGDGGVGGQCEALVVRVGIQGPPEVFATACGI